MVLRINTRNRDVFRIDMISLGKVEYETLLILADGEFHLSEEIYEYVHNSKKPKNSRAVTLTVAHLREKGIPIETQDRHGYRIKTPILLD